ncbi:MAG: phosphatase PAP2 family protein [Dehalococcoidia bacterium]
MPRPVRAFNSLLPKGWGDALRQLAFFFFSYQGYQVVRGLSEGREDLAFDNAHHLIGIERSLGTFFEASFQQSLLDDRWVIDVANWMYVNTHYVITTSFIVWLYLFRNEHFYFVRNMFVVAMGIALLGYSAFPTAPPRFLADLGFTDTIAAFTAVEQDSKAISLLVNQYAAVPSMHIGFALMIAVPGIRLCQSLVARALWSGYPVMVFFVIVITANHFWLDAAAGALAAAAAAVTAQQLARLRPQAWSWRGAPEQAAA